MYIDILKDICRQWRHQTLTVILISLCFIATSCDRELDELIPQPTETSTIISGYIKTPEGTPLQGIPVAVDFKATGIFGTTVIHKAKGVTDKAGYYKIFFEADIEDQGLRSGYVFSADFSSLSQDDYIITNMLDYGFTAINNEWSGSAIKCDFTIPHKKLVAVTVKNRGIPVVEGKYAVKNMFRYLKVEGYLHDNKNPWNDMAIWQTFESVEIPMNGTISVAIPCALNLENAIQLVYDGYESYGYPNEIPASEGRKVEINDKFKDTVELSYITPDPANRWENEVTPN